MGVARKKDNEGITNKQEVVFREIIKGESNIGKKYTKLKTQCSNYVTEDGRKLNFYIYVSVNGRDVRKGYIAFKEQLVKYEREIIFGTECSMQLKRIDSIWLSAIMKPESRSLENKRFLIDIDTKDEKILSSIELYLKHEKGIIELKQETKNGWHYITNPFNKQSFVNTIIYHGLEKVCEVKTDALLFVEHIDTTSQYIIGIDYGRKEK